MHFTYCLSLKVFTTTRSFNVCLKNVNKLDIYSHHTMFHIYCNLYGKCITIFLQLQQLCRRWFGFAVTIVAGTLLLVLCSNFIAATLLVVPKMKLLQAGCGNLLATACSKAAKTNCCNYGIFIREVCYCYFITAWLFIRCPQYDRWELCISSVRLLHQLVYYVCVLRRLNAHEQ